MNRFVSRVVLGVEIGVNFLFGGLMSLIFLIQLFSEFSSESKITVIGLFFILFIYAIMVYYLPSLFVRLVLNYYKLKAERYVNKKLIWGYLIELVLVCSITVPPLIFKYYYDSKLKELVLAGLMSLIFFIYSYLSYIENEDVKRIGSDKNIWN